MQVKANVRFRDRYDGEKSVYLTAIELDSGSNLKISGEFPHGFPELHVDFEMDAELIGVVFNNQFSLRCDDQLNFKLKKLKVRSKEIA